MGDTSWNEVGQRFAELGRRLQDGWKSRESDVGSRAQIEDAGDKVRAALDDLADAINRAAGSPGVHDAARRATSGVAEALAGTLQDLAARLDGPPPPPKD